MSIHIHGPYSQRHLVEIIKDLLSGPQDWKMSCKQGKTIVKFRRPKNDFRARCKLQNEIANHLNVPERKFSRELILKRRGKK